MAAEAAILQSLERAHPNLVQYYGWCKVQGLEALVMEFAEYGSLEHLLHRCAAALPDVCRRGKCVLFGFRFGLLALNAFLCGGL